jgi:hypothetical protein
MAQEQGAWRRREKKTLYIAIYFRNREENLTAKNYFPEAILKC